MHRRRLYASIHPATFQPGAAQAPQPSSAPVVLAEGAPRRGQRLKRQDHAAPVRRFQRWRGAAQLHPQCTAWLPATVATDSHDPTQTRMHPAGALVQAPRQRPAACSPHRNLCRTQYLHLIQSTQRQFTTLTLPQIIPLSTARAPAATRPAGGSGGAAPRPSASCTASSASRASWRRTCAATCAAPQTG
jgi:hypothetical protein